MKRLRRFETTLLAAAALLQGCGATGSTLEVNAGAQLGGMAAPIPKPLPTRLVPQPEGTALPPRDLSVADQWPPEIKQLVDNMLTLFPRSASERPPSVQEVAKKMSITLTEMPLLEPLEKIRLSKRYAISGTRYVDPESRSFGRADRYVIVKLPEGRRSQHLTLVLGPAQSGYCLDPYELAIYTGSKFTNADTSPHAGIRYWPPAYAWGMFRWSNTGRYAGEGFAVLVGQDRDSGTRAILGDGCVAALTVVGRYEEEER